MSGDTCFEDDGAERGGDCGRLFFESSFLLSRHTAVDLTDGLRTGASFLDFRDCVFGEQSFNKYPLQVLLSTPPEIDNKGSSKENDEGQ